MGVSVCLLTVALIQTIPWLYPTRSQCDPVTITASSRPPELLRFDVSDSKTAQKNHISGGWRVTFWLIHTQGNTLFKLYLCHTEWLLGIATFLCSLPSSLWKDYMLELSFLQSFLCIPSLTLLNLDSTQSPLSSCPQRCHSAFLYCLFVIS